MNTRLVAAAALASTAMFAVAPTQAQEVKPTSKIVSETAPQRSGMFAGPNFQKGAPKAAFTSEQAPAPDAKVMSFTEANRVAPAAK